MYRKLTLLICAALSITVVSAQTESSKQKELFHNYSKLLSPEKVYLHTDKDVYFATDTIWFSGYVENASYASEFDESNYIYVELINDQLYRNDRSFSQYAEYVKEVVVRKKIRRIGNNFQGHIVVPEMNSTGRAVIRAYTYWMLNRPAEYMFYKELELVNPMKDKLVAAMAEKKVKHKKDYLRIGELSPDDKEKAESGKEDKERYDVQFLPESGNYVSGEKAIVYIKAIGQGGAGAAVFGEIVDSDNNVIASYNTDSLGFGKTVIASLPHGKLTATVKDTLGFEGKRIKLPQALANGVTINGSMNVSAQEYANEDKAVFMISTSETLLSNSLHIYLHNGSEIYYSKPLSKAEEKIALGLLQLTPGIHSISVVDARGNVYAERPFVVLPSQKEALAIGTQQEQYGKREQMNVKIKLPKEMLGSSSNFSVSVTDMGVADNSEKTTLPSYMLLKSELKGYIENIEWYFTDTISLASRMQRADMLMQTHGWRYYDTEKILQGKSETPYFGREYKQTLFGKVVNPIGLTKKATVSFIAQSINFRAMGQIDSGYFVLKDVDFPENTRFIVSAVGKNGKSQNHTPVLQNDWFAPMYEYPVKTEKVKYTPKFSTAVESIYYSKDDGEHAMAFELNPIVVTSQLVTLKNSPAPLPNYPLRREWIRDSLDMKPYSRSYTVGQYVTQAYPGVREYYGGFGERVEKPRDLNGEPIPAGVLIGPKKSPASMNGRGYPLAPGRWGVVLTYLNGMYVPAMGEQSVYSVLNIPLSEVESIVYVSGLAAAPFQPAFEMGELFSFPVLMVRTKPHVRTDLVPYNVTSAYPLGWQKPARFYSPKYDTPGSKKSKAKDNRITLYWNPAVKLDENGEATISFYTSDSDSQYRIEVEGRSASRQYHYVEKVIERKVESEPASRRK